MVTRSSPTASFGSELQALAQIAENRPNHRVRVLVELDLDKEDSFDAAQRTRHAWAESRHRRAVEQRQDGLIQALGAQFARGEPGYVNRIDGLPFVSLLVDANELERLAQLPFVVSIAEEAEGDFLLVDTVPQIKANMVHSGGNTGTYRTVAVIDSGVQTNHPFFGSRILAGACYSTSEPGLGSNCAGGVPSGSTTIASGGPCTTPAPVSGSTSQCAHGTHVAGIAIGSAAGIKGVAPAANLISIQVSSLTNTCGAGNPTPCRRILESDVVNALMRVYALRNTHPIASVNMSFGLGSSFYQSDCRIQFSAVAQAIDALEAANISVVAASGNSAISVPSSANKLAVPACIAKTISVASVGKDDTFAAYSNANQSFLDILAPGGVLSDIESSAVGSGYAPTHGTSQAAPHVAGALALLRNVFPYASPRALQAQLKSTGPLIAVSYPGYSYTKRRLDVNAARTGPAAPTGSVGPVTVTREFCYGSNQVDWSAVPGADEYHVEGSASSSFTLPKLFALTQDSVTDAGIDVPATRYIRVRACKGVACGPWTTASPTATYYNGCL